MRKRTMQQAIREERTRRGMSQRQLANAVGVSTPLVSWAETGTQPVSLQVKKRILEALELDPRDFPEAQEPSGEESPPDGDPPGAGRAPREKKPDPVPEPEPTREETTATTPQRELDPEEKEILTNAIERTLRIWSRMSDLHQHADGRWHTPPGIKGPEEIALEAMRGGLCDQDTHRDEGMLLDLREGLVELKATREHPGRVRLELMRHPPGDDAPAWVFESDHQPVSATVQFLPVLPDGRRHPGDNRRTLQPGLHRLRAEADTPWQFQWRQHAPGTGWIDLLEDPRVQREGEFNPGGLNWMGPTAPNWTAVEVMVQQEEKARMEVWAHPVDGGKETLLVQQDVGTEPARLPADLDPEQEYIIVVMTEARWDLWFVNNQEGANKSDGD